MITGGIGDNLIFRCGTAEKKVIVNLLSVKSEDRHGICLFQSQSILVEDEDQ